MNNRELFDLIKTLNIVDQKQLESALSDSDEKNSFRQLLIDRGILTSSQINRVVAEKYDLPTIDLSKIKPIGDLNDFNSGIYEKLNLVVFEIDEINKVGKIACSNPSDKEIIQNLQKKFGFDFKLYYSSEDDIVQFIKSIKYESYTDQDPFEELLKKLKDSSDPKNHVISDILTKIVSLAVQYKASDVHLEPEESISLLRYRIDGILQDISSFPIDIHNRLISRIKVISKLKTDEHLSAQDGKMQQESDGEKIDIRVSIVPITYGEKAVLRLLSNKVRNYTLQDLGITDEDFEKIKIGFSAPDGMVLSTGPTASGKTTTIYSIIRAINSKDMNIATIEDPVEYTIPRVNQIQVNNDTNLTFANGLKSILRQDPDVIFVGEIRDSDTAKIAVNSAMTGHLVLSTLHTNNAAMTIPRLFNMGIEPFLIASTIRVVIAQRLVRRVCESCRQSFEVSNTESKDTDIFIKDNLHHMEAIPNQILEKYFNMKELTLYKGKGCEVCHNTGYSGRVGIFEVLTITPEISNLISKKATMEEINELAISQGMKTILEDGVFKVSRGLTTFEEIFRVIQEA